MKQKYIFSLIGILLLASCQGPSETTTSQDEQTTMTTTNISESDTTSQNEPTTSSVEDTRIEKSVTFSFASKQSSNFGYNDGQNQSKFLTDYFREDDNDVVANAITTSARCGEDYVYIGSQNSFGSMLLTIDEKYEVRTVIMTARGYCKYIAYSDSYSSDDATLRIEDQDYKMPYAENVELESIDCRYEYHPETNEIFMESVGQGGKRVQFISLEIIYVDVI